MSLDLICRELKNWFETEKVFQTFTIKNGELIIPNNVKTLPLDGQYIRIIGSVFNDGVYQFPVSGLEHDETFHGAIWYMAVPTDIIELSADVDAWLEKYKDVSESPYSSESFGGYSYSKAQAFAGVGGGFQSSWQAVFISRLNKWRKI